MNEAEQNAYGQMAQALAWHADSWARGWDFKFPGVSEPIYHHLSDSTFEGVADCLWKLKIFKALDEKGNGASNFVLNCELNDAYRVAVASRETGPSFDELLYTLVYLFGDYGTEYWGFSTQRRVPFGKDGRLVPLLEALVPLGYLEKSEVGYVWTDRVEPIMYAAGYAERWSD
ncbi:hypothetical protein LJR220_002419 [Bradyrhizobium sp. LjRoot220]|uniref:hypothetical protein n=1 Tax=Bradyrhizobium sp. LjRoot220 TaxID=3342284 RepID=UPI003ED05A8A